MEKLIMLGGKERVLRFDIGTLKLIAQKTKEDALTPLEGMDGFAQALYACYYGMVRHYRVMKQELDFTLQDVEGWFDELSYHEMVDIMQAYNEAYSPKEESAGEPGEGDKKK